jgi:hypothetical protein
MKRVLIAFAMLLIVWRPAAAHIGSPDVFFQGAAGPYRLLVVVRMPRVIPGIADIEVRSLSTGLQSVRVTPMRIRGLGSELSPAPDVAERTQADTNVYRAQLWLMQRGAWKVHVEAGGDVGTGELAVPVGATSSATRPMGSWLKGILGLLGLLLVAGAIAIVGASVRESSTPPGLDPSARTTRRARVAMIGASALVSALVAVAWLWWRDAAADADAAVYQAPRIAATLADPKTLSLSFSSSAQAGRRQERVPPIDLVADHGHLMHLFVLRDPGMDFLVHLHPAQNLPAQFSQELPSMPGGRYRIFADVVHGSGFPETATGELSLPDVVSGLPTGDDALVQTMPLVAGPQTGSAPLSLGARMVWLEATRRVRAGESVWLKFRVEDRDGRGIEDLEPYMGMAGHLVVVRSDWGVFAHLHPAGSAPMAAVELANGAGTNTHAGHQPSPVFASAASSPASNPELSFPYGFPSAGHYRLFVQIKRAGRVETGVFDTKVEPS